MANDDRTSEVLLKYRVDEASIGSVKRSVAGIYGEFKKLEGNVGSASATTKNLQVQLKALERAESIHNLTKRFAEMGVETKRSGEFLERLQIGLRDVGASTVEISRATRAFLEMERAAEGANRAASGGSRGGINLQRAESVGSQLQRGLRGVGLTSIAEPIDVGADALQSVLAGKEAIAGLAAAAGPLAPVLVAGAAAVGLFALAMQDANQKAREAEKGVLAILSTQDKYYDIIETGTRETITAAIEEEQRARAEAQAKLKENLFILKEQLKDLPDFIGLSDEEFLKKFQEPGRVFIGLSESASKASENIRALQGEIANSDSLMGRLTGALNSFRVQMEDAAKAAELAAAAEKFYHDTVVENQEKRREAFAAQLKEERDFRDKQLSEVANIQDKYNKTIEAITQEQTQKEIEIKAKAAEKIADIIQKEIDAADAALAKLNERESEIADDFEKQNIKDEIKAREQDRDDLVQHLRKVRDIQNKFASDERDALLDRNFLQLFKLQESKREQLAEEDVAFKEQQEDEARQREIQRQERFADFQQRLLDARAAYQKELQQARDAKVKQIELARAAEIAEIELAKQGASGKRDIAFNEYTELLKIANLGSAARIQLEAQTQAELIAQAQATLAALGVSANFNTPIPSVVDTGNFTNSTDAGRVRFFADAGVRGKTFGPGTIGGINDGYRGQRESINGVKMPPGLGFFVSTSAGRVTDDATGGGIGTLHMPISIQGADAHQVVQLARVEIVKALDTVLNRRRKR